MHTEVFNTRLDILDPVSGEQRTLIALPAGAAPRTRAFAETSVSQDGERVSVSGEAGVSVFQTRTGKPLLVASSCDYGLLSPNGRFLLAHKKDGAVQIWGVEGDRPQSLAFATDPRAGIGGGRSAFSPNSHLAAFLTPHGVQVCTTETGRIAAQIPSDKAAFDHIEFSPDGHLLFTWTITGDVGCWSVQTWRATCAPLRQRAMPRLLPTFITFSADGRRALTPGSGSPATMTLWNLTTGRPLSTQAPLHCEVDWKFSPDGHLFATASPTPCVWEAETGRLVAKLPVAWAVNSLLFTPDSRRILTLGADSIALLWNVRTGRALTPPMRHPRSVQNGAFTPDGSLLATVCEDGMARIWDTTTGEPVTLPFHQTEPITQCAFLPSGQSLLTISSREIRRWNLTHRPESLERLQCLSNILSGRPMAPANRKAASLSPVDFPLPR